MSSRSRGTLLVQITHACPYSCYPVNLRPIGIFEVFFVTEANVGTLYFYFSEKDVVGVEERGYTTDGMPLRHDTVAPPSLMRTVM